MRIGTMTCLYRDQRETDELIGYADSMKLCLEAGFNILDFSFCALLRGNTELNGDDWQERLNLICREKEKLGIEVVQSHPPFRPFPWLHFPTPEEDERYAMLVKRSLDASAALGVKWAVMHPVTAFSGNTLDPDSNLALNHEAYDWVVEYANKRNIGIVFENLFDGIKVNRRCFGISAEDLIMLMDSFRGASTGICWDTGHANRTYADQVPAIKKLGRRIKATHIHDNDGSGDQHLLPFLGTINWEGVIKAFRESGCEADLILELSANNRMPLALRDNNAKFAGEVSRYLLSLTG